MAEKKGKITLNFIQEQLDENELDLSMNAMDTVPVRELAKVKKGTKLDLSRNNLQSLPENVGILSHLLSLDLSNNQLRSLPESFGKLSLLQKLDLYGNQLTSLPISFWHLKKLRWLDLKKNPLEEELEQVAGGCVSLQDCTQCASQVLAYMKQRSSQAERDRQNELHMQREQELKRKEDEARHRAAVRKERAALHNRKEQEKVELNNGNTNPTPPLVTASPQPDADKVVISEGVGGCGVCVRRVGRVCTWVVLLLLILILLLVLALLVCPLVMESSSCRSLHSALLYYMARLLHVLGLDNAIH